MVVVEYLAYVAFGLVSCAFIPFTKKPFIFTAKLFKSRYFTISTHDLSEINEVLGCLNLRKEKVLIDGIADHHDLYRKCERYNKQLLTPPRKGSTINEANPQRNDSIRIIKALGGDLEAKSIWGKLTGYNQRSQIETLFSRWKRTLRETLKSKLESKAANEA